MRAMRFMRWAMAFIALALLALVVRPYVHGLSFVIRAAEMQGAARRVADWDTTNVTTREIAMKWPSAKEAWGYEEEDQAAANLWGHGLGLAQYDPPVISRIWSLDHPIEIKAGMTFALETQHGKRFRYGVRIEEMLIVHDKEIEIISNFPVKQITVVDPIPGYGDHVQ